MKAVRILVLESNDSSISQIIEILKNNDFYIDCDKCVKVCPIDELDIKAGFDIRCVQCGLCESACESVMLKFNKTSLITKKFKDRNIFRSFSKNGYILGVFILVIIILTIVYLLNGAFLDNCYFTNKSLY